MDGIGQGEERTDARSSARRAGILVALVALIFLVMFWSSFRYFGLASKLAEWQFAHLHQWFPMFTALVFCGLGAALWFALVWLNKRRLKATGRLSAEDELHDSKRRIGAVASGLLIFATLCGTLVLGGLVYWLTLPTLGGETDARAWDAPGVAREGGTSLAGARLVGPVARYQEAVFGIGPDQYFAPIAKQAGSDSFGQLTLFAEVTIVGGRPRLPTNGIGILRQDALPGELDVLYRNNGYPVAKGVPVIFRSAASSGRGTLVFMIEALALGLNSLVCGLFLRRRYRRLEAGRSRE